MWELDGEEGWVLKNWYFWTVALEKTLERPLDCKEIQPVHSEGDQPWDFFGRTDAKAETLVLWPPHAKHWKRLWCWEGLGAGGEGDDRGWDGWMVSLTQWTWVWVNFRSWWRTGRPGVLWFMGSQRVGHNWATELGSGIIFLSTFYGWLSQKHSKWIKQIIYYLVSFSFQNFFFCLNIYILLYQLLSLVYVKDLRQMLHISLFFSCFFLFQVYF